MPITWPRDVTSTMTPPLPLKNGSFHLAESSVAKSGLMSFSSTHFLRNWSACRYSGVSKPGTSLPLRSPQAFGAPNHVSNTSYGLSYTHLRAHETGRNLVCRL